MPKEGENVLKFNNFHKQQAVPFVIYADLEAITKKVQGCEPNDDKNHTQKPIRFIKTVAMDIRQYVTMMISTQSLLRCIGERMLYIGF